jgi:hypothetical protein
MGGRYGVRPRHGGTNTYAQRAIPPDLISSVSGLLRDSAHVRQARSRCLQCCPGVAAIPSRDRPIGHAAGTSLFVPN